MQVAPITQQTAPLSRAIAERVVELGRGGVPQDVWQYLKLCLADALGIAFASRHYEFSRKSGDFFYSKNDFIGITGLESQYEKQRRKREVRFQRNRCVIPENKATP